MSSAAKISEITYGGFSFSEPHWLWLLMVVPLIWLLYSLFYKSGPVKDDRLKAFADPHLLPHLLEGSEGGTKKNTVWRSLLIWSIIWLCGTLAMAGPRWDYTEIEAFRPANALVVLLDLSRSMDVSDVKPSRLARARQEIEDILKSSQALNIGLVAFANIAHLITPLTDDKVTLERLLPSIKTDLVYTRGSRLSPALHMARKMLESQKGEEKHILVLSDGGYEEPDGPIYRAIREITDEGMKVHVLALGTEQGGPVPDGNGGYVRSYTGQVISKLDSARLKRIASDGQGLFHQASFSDQDTAAILAQIDFKADESEDTRKLLRFWEERFYVFLIPCLVLLLPLFRRGAAFPLLIFVMLSLASPVQALDWRDLFLTREQKGRQALEQKKYDEAEQIFDDDPYRRGVVEYKAGKYEEAEKSFEQVERPEVRENAKYNQGNAQLMSGKIKDAIESYEKVLKENPDHKDAQHNLDVAKKMLEQQEKQKKQDQQQQDQQQQDQQQQDQQQQDQQQQDQQQQDQQQQDQQQQDQQQQKNNESPEAEKQESKNSASEDTAEKRRNQEKSQKDAEQKQGEDKNQQHSEQGTQEKGQETNAGQKKEEEKKAPEGYPPSPDRVEQKKNAENQQKQEKTPDQNPKTPHNQQHQDPHPQDRNKMAQDDKADDSQQQNGNVEPSKRPSLRDQVNQQRQRDERPRTQQDINADQWLSHIESDTETFLKNKFYIESMQSGATEGGQTW